MPIDEAIDITTSGQRSPIKKKKKQKHIERKLENASNDFLERIALYNKPKWKAIQVRAFCVDNFDKLEILEGSIPILKDIEILCGSTLGDLRKLVRTFLKEIPDDFVFSKVQELKRETKYIMENNILVDDCLQENEILIYFVDSKKISKKTHEGTKQQDESMKVVDSSGLDKAKESPPIFSATNRFGDFQGSADIFMKKGHGITIRLSDIVHVVADINPSRSRYKGKTLEINLTTRAIAQKSSMSETTLQVLLSTSKGQMNILQKLLSQICLKPKDDAVNDIQLSWTISDEPTNVQLSRTKKIIPSKLPTSLESPRKTKLMKRESQTQKDQSPSKLSKINSSLPLLPEKQSNTPIQETKLEEDSKITSIVEDIRAENDTSQKQRLGEEEEDMGNNLKTKKKRPREESVKILKSCLEIACRNDSEAYSKHHLYQMIFDELILRDYACMSLPEFIQAARVDLKEVFRSCNLSESLMKTCIIVWIGFHVTLWDAKITSCIQYFQDIIRKSIDIACQKLVIARFEGFEPLLESNNSPTKHALLETSSFSSTDDIKLEPDVQSKAQELNAESSASISLKVPRRIELLIKALSICSNCSDTYEADEYDDDDNVSDANKSRSTITTDVSTVGAIKMLALHDIRISRRRKRVFSSIPKSKSQNKTFKTFSVAALQELKDILNDPEFAQSFTEDEEILYNASLLYEIVYLVLDYVDFQLPRYFQRIHRNGDQHAHISNALRSILKSVGTCEVQMSKQSLDLANIFESFFLENSFNQMEQSRISQLLSRNDGLRWHKAIKDCQFLTSQQTSTKLRWFIQPLVSYSCSYLKDEKYLFVGEGDLLCEWSYLEYSNRGGINQTCMASSSEFFQRAMKKVMFPERFCEDAAALLVDFKFAFGVNFRHGNLLSDFDRYTSLGRKILQLESIESISIGYDYNYKTGVQAVIFRVFANGAELKKNSTVAGLHTRNKLATRSPSFPLTLESSQPKSFVVWSLSQFIDALKLPSTKQRLMIDYGCLHLLRLSILREIVSKKRGEEILSLDNTIVLAHSVYHEAFEAVLESALLNRDLITNPYVFQLLLWLVLANKVDEYYISRFFQFVETVVTSPKAKYNVQVTDLMSVFNCKLLYMESFQLKTCRSLRYDDINAPPVFYTDVYDVLWYVGQCSSRETIEVHECAKRIATQVFFYPGILNEYRVLRYSTYLNESLLGMELVKTTPVQYIIAPGKEALLQSRKEYFDHLVPTIEIVENFRMANDSSSEPIVQFTCGSWSNYQIERFLSSLIASSDVLEILCLLFCRYFGALSTHVGAQLLTLDSRVVNFIFDLNAKPYVPTQVLTLVVKSIEYISLVCCGEDKYEFREKILGLNFVEKIHTALRSNKSIELGTILLSSLGNLMTVSDEVLKKVLNNLVQSAITEQDDAKALMDEILQVEEQHYKSKAFYKRRRLSGTQPALRYFSTHRPSLSEIHHQRQSQLHPHEAQYHAPEFHPWHEMLHEFVLRQHQLANRCPCKQSADMNSSFQGRLIANTSKKAVFGIIGKAVNNILQSQGIYLHADTKNKGFHSTRCRVASTIQRQVMRWLYVSKRGKLVLPLATKWKVCTSCNHSTSFIAALVQSISLLHQNITSEEESLSRNANAQVSKRSIGARMDTNVHEKETSSSSQKDDTKSWISLLHQTLLCIRYLLRDPMLCRILSQDFRIEYTLLKCCSYEDSSIRTTALHALAEISWRFKGASEFVNARLGQRIWGNKDSTLWLKSNIRGRSSCSWIEYITRAIVEKYRALKINISHTTRDSALMLQVYREIDAASSLLMVLSYDQRNAPLLLTSLPNITKYLSKWVSKIDLSGQKSLQGNTSSTSYIQIRFLIAIQNVVLLSEGLLALHEEYAVTIFEDLDPILFNGADDPLGVVTQGLICGSLWTLSLWQNIRKKLMSHHSIFISRLVNLLSTHLANMSVLRERIQKDNLMILFFANILGAISSLTIEGVVNGIDQDFVSRINSLYLVCDEVEKLLELIEEATEQDQRRKSSDRGITRASMRSSGTNNRRSLSLGLFLSGEYVLTRPFIGFSSLWIQQLHRYRLVPEMGSLRGFAGLRQNIQSLRHQAFRLFAVVSYNPLYSADLRRKTTTFCAILFPLQLNNSNFSGCFAIKILPELLSLSKGYQAEEDLLEYLAPIVLKWDNNVLLRPKLLDLRMMKKIIRTARLIFHEFPSKVFTFANQVKKKLAELLELYDTDEELSIALIGLLTQMMKADHTDQELQRAFFDSEMTKVMSNQVAVVMNLLQSREDTRLSLITHISTWSPLQLDSTGRGQQSITFIEKSLAGTQQSADTSAERSFEITSSIRWPIEFLYMLYSNIKLNLTRGDIEVLVKILVDLEQEDIRNFPHIIQGKAELILQISQLVRAHAGGVDLSGQTALNVLSLLIKADPMRSYSSELAMILTECLNHEECTETLLDESNMVLVKLLTILTKPNPRLDLVYHCIILLESLLLNSPSKIEILWEQLSLFQRQNSKGFLVLYEVALLHFSPTMYVDNVAVWSLLAKCFKIFGFLLEYSACSSHRFSKVFLEQLSQPNEAEQTLCHEFLSLAFQMVHFQYWIGTIPIKEERDRPKILQAAFSTCFDATKLAVQVLSYMKSHETDNKNLIKLAPLQLMKEEQVIMGPLSTQKYSNLDALVHSFSLSYFRLRDAPIGAYHLDPRLVEEFREVISLGLARLMFCHEARHSVVTTDFVIRNYGKPLFEERNNVVKFHLLRMYRLCCCNAAIYRIIRLGKITLWNRANHLPPQQDQTFFYRLGQSYQVCSVLEWSLRNELALFLTQESFAFDFDTDHPKKIAQSEEDKNVIRSLVHLEGLLAVNEIEENTNKCLQPRFGREKLVSGLTVAAKDFEAGILDAQCELRNAGSGHVLVNALIQLLTDHWLELNEHEGSNVIESNRRSTFGNNLTNEDDIVLLSDIVSGLMLDFDSSLSSPTSPSRKTLVSTENIRRVLHIIASVRNMSGPMLEMLFNILYVFMERLSIDKMPNSMQEYDLIQSLVPRLGQKGIQTFGAQSSLVTLDYILLVLSKNMGCSIPLSQNESFVNAVFELFRIQVTTKTTSLTDSMDRLLQKSSEVLKLLSVKHGCVGKDFDNVAEYLIMALESTTSDTSMMLKSMDHECENDRSLSVPSFMGVLMSSILNVDVLESAGENLLEFIYNLLIGQPEVMLHRILDHGALLVLFHNLYLTNQRITHASMKLIDKITETVDVQNTTENPSISIMTKMLISYGIPVYNGPLVESEFNVKSVHDMVSLQRERKMVLDLLRRLPIFATLRPNELYLVAEAAKVCHFGKDMLLDQFRENLYLITSGKVEWGLHLQVNGSLYAHSYSNKEHVIFEKGSIVGAINFLNSKDKDSYPLHEFASALSEVVCLAIPTSLLYQQGIWSKISLKIQESTLRCIAGPLFNCRRSNEEHKTFVSNLKILYRQSYIDQIIRLMCQSHDGNKNQGMANRLLIKFAISLHQMVKACTFNIDFVYALYRLHQVMATDNASFELLQAILTLELELLSVDNSKFGVTNVLERYTHFSVTMDRPEPSLSGLVAIGKILLKCTQDIDTLASWMLLVSKVMKTRLIRNECLSRVLDKSAVSKLGCILVEILRDKTAVKIKNNFLCSFLHVISVLTRNAKCCLSFAADLSESDKMDLFSSLIKLLGDDCGLAKEAGTEYNVFSKYILSTLVNCTRLPLYKNLVVGIQSAFSPEKMDDNDLNLFTKCKKVYMDGLSTEQSRLDILQLFCNVLESKNVASSTRDCILIWLDSDLFATRTLIGSFHSSNDSMIHLQSASIATSLLRFHHLSWGKKSHYHTRAPMNNFESTEMMLLVSVESLLLRLTSQSGEDEWIKQRGRSKLVGKILGALGLLYESELIQLDAPHFSSIILLLDGLLTRTVKAKQNQLIALQKRAIYALQQLLSNNSFSLDKSACIPKYFDPFLFFATFKPVLEDAHYSGCYPKLQAFMGLFLTVIEKNRQRTKYDIGNERGTDLDISKDIINFLLNIIRPRSCYMSTKVRRTSMNCILEFFRYNLFKQLIQNAGSWIIAQLIASLEDFGATTLKIFALKMACQSFNPQMESYSENLDAIRMNGSRAIAKVLSKSLHIQSTLYDIAEIILWLLKHFGGSLEIKQEEFKYFGQCFVYLLDERETNHVSFQKSFHGRFQQLLPAASVLEELVRFEKNSLSDECVIKLIANLCRLMKEIASIHRVNESDMQGALFLTCVSCLRCLFRGKNYKKFLYQELDRNYTFILSFDRVFEDLQHYPLAYRRGIYDLTCICLNCISLQESRRAIVQEYLLNLKYTSWVLLLEVTTFEDVPHIYLILRLLCRGNLNIYKFYLAPESQLLPMIITHLKDCKNLLDSDDLPTSTLYNNLLVLRRCGDLVKDLFFQEIRAIEIKNTNQIKMIRILTRDFVNTLMGILYSFNEYISRMQQPSKAGENTELQKVAKTMLSLLQSFIKHQPESCSEELWCGAVPDIVMTLGLTFEASQSVFNLTLVIIKRLFWWKIRQNLAASVSNEVLVRYLELLVKIILTKCDGNQLVNNVTTPCIIRLNAIDVFLALSRASSETCEYFTRCDLFVILQNLIDYPEGISCELVRKLVSSHILISDMHTAQKLYDHIWLNYLTKEHVDECRFRLGVSISAQLACESPNIRNKMKGNSEIYWRRLAEMSILFEFNKNPKENIWLVDAVALLFCHLPPSLEEFELLSHEPVDLLKTFMEALNYVLSNTRMQDPLKSTRTDKNTPRIISAVLSILRGSVQVCSRALCRYSVQFGILLPRLITRSQLDLQANHQESLLASLGLIAELLAVRVLLTQSGIEPIRVEEEFLSYESQHILFRVLLHTMFMKGNKILSTQAVLCIMFASKLGWYAEDFSSITSADAVSSRLRELLYDVSTVFFAYLDGIKHGMTDPNRFNYPPNGVNFELCFPRLSLMNTWSLGIDCCWAMINSLAHLVQQPLFNVYLKDHVLIDELCFILYRIDESLLHFNSTYGYQMKKDVLTLMESILRIQKAYQSEIEAITYASVIFSSALSEDLILSTKALDITSHLLRNEVFRQRFAEGIMISVVDSDCNLQVALFHKIRSIIHANEDDNIDGGLRNVCFRVLSQLAKVPCLVSVVNSGDEEMPLPLLLLSYFEGKASESKIASSFLHMIHPTEVSISNPHQLKFLQNLAYHEIARPMVMLSENTIRTIKQGCLLDNTVTCIHAWNALSSLTEYYYDEVELNQQLNILDSEKGYLRQILRENDYEIVKACEPIMRSALHQIEKCQKGEFNDIDCRKKLKTSMKILSSCTKVLFNLTSSKSWLKLRTIVAHHCPGLASVILSEVRVILSEQLEELHDDMKAICVNAIRILRRLSSIPVIAELFRKKNVDGGPITFLKDLCDTAPKAIISGNGAALVYEIVHTIKHLTKDREVCETLLNINVRPGISLFDVIFEWFDPAHAAFGGCWEVFLNFTEQNLHVKELTDNLTTADHLTKLNTWEWTEESFESMGFTVTKVLRKLSSKNHGTHSRMIQMCPLLSNTMNFLTHSESIKTCLLESYRDESINYKYDPYGALYNITKVISKLISSTEENYAAFLSIINLAQNVFEVCEQFEKLRLSVSQTNNTEEEKIPPQQHQLTRSSSGDLKNEICREYSHKRTRLYRYIELTLAAICKLLLVFHHEESARIYAGYHIQLVKVKQNPAVLSKANSFNKKKDLPPPSFIHNKLSIRCKKQGIFSKNGFSPSSFEVLKKVLGIFEKCLFLGKNIPATRESCQRTIIAFFSELAETSSGRFMLLNRCVIDFIRCILMSGAHREELGTKMRFASLDDEELNALMELLLKCSHYHTNTRAFLLSGSIQLLLETTVYVIQKAYSHHNDLYRKKRIHHIFMMFATITAILTERPSVLQSTFYLQTRIRFFTCLEADSMLKEENKSAEEQVDEVDEEQLEEEDVQVKSEENGLASMTLVGLLIGSIVYSGGCSAYLLLSCKVLARVMLVLSLHENKKLLRRCVIQLRQCLGFRVTKKDISLALCTMLLRTETEAQMKNRVLVRVVHSTLMRTAIMGWIDKGLPQTLHDHGLSRMMQGMNDLISALRDYEDHHILGKHDHDHKELKVAKTMLVQGFSDFKSGLEQAIGMIPRGSIVGPSPADTHQKRLTEKFENESNSRILLVHIIDILKDLTSEVAHYTRSNYKEVFNEFESKNDDLDLIAAIKSSKYAIMCTQTIFYGLHLFQEALTAALATQYVGSQGEERAEVSIFLKRLGVFLTKIESIFGWIVICLQNSDMDLVFFGNQTRRLFQLFTLLVGMSIKDSSDNGNEHRSSFLSDKNAGSSSVVVRFESLALNSWLWMILGFRPYLVVKSRKETKFVRFEPASTDIPTKNDGANEFSASFQVQTPEYSDLTMSFLDRQHALHVEIYMYIPFWWKDRLVSRANIPLAVNQPDGIPFAVRFDPNNSRGAHNSKVFASLTLQLHELGEGETISSSPMGWNDFPVYSTFGSRWIRLSFKQLLLAFKTVAAIALVYAIGPLKSVLESFNHIIYPSSNLQAALELPSSNRKLTTISPHAKTTDQDTATIEKISVEDQTKTIFKEIIVVLRQMTSSEKLLGSYEKNNAAIECNILLDDIEHHFVDQISEQIGLIMATSQTEIWRKLKASLKILENCFMSSGFSYFSSNTYVPTTSLVPPSTGLSTETPITINSKSRKRFCEVSSQLRTSIHHHEHIPTSAEGDIKRKDRRRSSIISSVTSSLKDNRRNQTGMTVNGGKKAISHTILPHMSIFNLSQPREPEWQSFAQMIAPDSLNHFLIQPMERLQVYCAVLQYIDAKNPLSSGSISSPSGSDLTRSKSDKSSNRIHGRVTPDNQNLDPKKGTEEFSPSTFPPPARIGSSSSRSISSFSFAATASFASRRFPSLKEKLQQMTSLSKNPSIKLVPNALMGVEHYEEVEVVRLRRLHKYHAADPFDARARLKRLYHDARYFPTILYREGLISTMVHYILWAILILTVWRASIARDAVRDSAKSFEELASEPNTTAASKVSDTTSGINNDAKEDKEIKTKRLVISNYFELTTEKKKERFNPLKWWLNRSSRDHSSNFSSSFVSRLQSVSRTNQGSTNDMENEQPHQILISMKELQNFVILLEVKDLFSDIVRIWPGENGNIGLGGFWSSIFFTICAFGTPFVFLKFVVPALIDTKMDLLSNLACIYGAFWISMAFGSILNVTRNIPAFKEVRRVETINLTRFPYCLRNHLAILSVIWEAFQLNTTSFAVWKSSYKPKQIAALTIVDLEEMGLGSIEVNVFLAKQNLSLICLILWFFSLKASNKFKSIQWLNYLLTFVLPNFLGGTLFMFLSKEFYLSTACVLDTQGDLVLWSDPSIHCWKGEHLILALRGLIGMSLFVPLAVLAFGSYQVFFPELNLDVQTSPLLNMSSQVVKAAMMGALTFFVNDVPVFLAVSLVGNLLLLVLVYKNPLACSTWHLKYAKLFIYAMSAWSAFCALLTTVVSEKEKDFVPLNLMHGGWIVQIFILVFCIQWRRYKQKKKTITNGFPSIKTEFFRRTRVQPALVKGISHSKLLFNNTPGDNNNSSPNSRSITSIASTETVKL